MKNNQIFDFFYEIVYEQTGIVGGILYICKLNLKKKDG